LLVDYLDEARPLPKDVPVEQLRTLQQEIQAQAMVSHAGWQRLGRMDLAWFLLMLHSGLRTGEVRRLCLQDVDWQGRKLRIEQGKGLKDRLVYLSQPSLQAIASYLEVRGPQSALPAQVFIFRHRPLTRSYCFQRLRTYAQRCGVQVTPHQLRHSCATLLLNCGAPVISVQALLGHQCIDTTLGYARLYDGTVAADYYAAMALVEQRLALPEDRLASAPAVGQLIALVDALHSGTLTVVQHQAVRQLRTGILALAAQARAIQDVKVLPPGV
jgi:integrase